ncbi:MAG: uroporphyrinogen-III synthase [Candidatus Azobacteroides sp.]|nr:uroporphyrinogen-III synthase [Candidatus Azobacteroides sp.]
MRIGALVGFISLFAPVKNVSAQTTVLITSPAGYSERFKNVFSESQLNPIAIPLIETVIPEDMPDVDSLFMNLQQYDYVAFSSRKAIESFDQVQKKRNLPLDDIKFCAIGKDAEYMYEKLGVRPAVHPDEPSPMGIADKLGEDENIGGKTIAVLVPLVEGIIEPDVVPNFLAKLSDIGMKVTRVNAYITRAVDKVQIDEAVKRIASKEIKCIAFTSSAEIEILLQNTGDKSLLDNITIACFGPYTAAYAQKRGLNVSVIAQDFSSFSGFLEAIEKYYRK